MLFEVIKTGIFQSFVGCSQFHTGSAASEPSLLPTHCTQDQYPLPSIPQSQIQVWASLNRFASKNSRISYQRLHKQCESQNHSYQYYSNHLDSIPLSDLSNFYICSENIFLYFRHFAFSPSGKPSTCK